MKKHIPNISNKKLSKLLAKYRNATSEKMKKRVQTLILITCMPIVTVIARAYARRSTDPVDDIIQVGALGLLKAIQLYTDDKNTTFTTYAMYFVTGEIRHYLRDKITIIRAPREIRELSYRIHKLTLDLTQRLGAPPTDEQLALELQIPQEKFDEVTEVDRRTMTISIDQAIAQEMENDARSIAEAIPDERDDTRRDYFEKRLALKNAMASLNEEERRLLGLFFFGGVSKREIAKMMNINTMRVSRLIKKILTKLFILVSKEADFND